MIIELDQMFTMLVVVVAVVHPVMVQAEMVEAVLETPRLEQLTLAVAVVVVILILEDLELR
jgi:hypothetical protein